MASESPRSSLLSGLQNLDISGVPSQIYVKRSLLHESSSSLILIVSGSPGVAQFYIPFANKLFEVQNQSMDVCVLGHLGHCPSVKNSSGATSRDWFSLEDQVAHKLAFLEEHYSHIETLYLVGHSIGCYIILQMLQKKCDQVEKAILLFPTIERMSESVNGKRFNLLFTTCLWLAVWLHWLSTMIPLCIRQKFMNIWFASSPITHRQFMVEATLAIEPTGLYNILKMADQEMKEVSLLPVNIIEQHLHKLVFFYGTDDPWVLSDCHSKLLNTFPKGDIQQCNWPHAFVLTNSNEIALFCHRKLQSLQ